MKKDKRDEKKKRLHRLKKYLCRLVKLGVNLRQDWFFHIVFGRNESAPMLCEVMNGVLRNVNEPTVKSIKIKNPFTFGASFDEKDVVVDVAVEDELGAQYDVEMQTCDHANFRERVVYYLEKIAAGQLAKATDTISCVKRSGSSLSIFRFGRNLIYRKSRIWRLN